MRHEYEGVWYDEVPETSDCEGCAFSDKSCPNFTLGCIRKAVIFIKSANQGPTEEVAPVEQPTTARDKGSSHYLGMDIQPWDVIDTWPLEQRIGFYRGNLLKYTMRMGTKDEAHLEIKKADHYAQKLEEVLKEVK